PLLIPLQSLLNSAKCALKEVRSALDLEILEHCASQFARLNEGWLDFRQELNMTTDKDLFLPIDTQSKTQTAPLAKAALAKAALLPLLEGKHIHQFNAEFAPPRFCVELKALQERLKSKEEHRAKK
ncbi:hypothetical protein, partial [Helicobacter vulpis]|uniref:hypothetical protein n=1 Tax=Helicobacter vulpis TaxID=2316076 RepID=UPI0013CDFFA5